MDVWTVTTTILFLVGVAVIVHREVSAFLVWLHAVRLRAQAKPVIDRRLEQLTEHLSPREIAPILAADLTNRDTTALIVDRSGEVIGSSTPIEGPEPLLLPAERYTRAFAENPHVTCLLRSPDGRRVLVLLIPPLPWRPHPPAVVQLATYLESDRERLRFLRILAAGLVPIAVLEVVLEVLLEGPFTLVALAALPLVLLVARIAREGSRPPISVETDRRPPPVGGKPAALATVLRRVDAAFLAQQACEERTRRFFVDASHELRTPLTSIGAAADVLLGGAKEDSVNVERLAGVIRSQADRMGRLIEDMLALARLEAVERPRGERLRLDELASECAEQLVFGAPARRIEIAADRPAWVLGDADELRQVLANLTSNALRHTLPDGCISIGVAVEGETATIVVADDGEGIPDSDVPLVFERFHRARGARSASGSGLGLAIVREIVRAHGGSVSVESRAGEGAKFQVVLPLAHGAGAARAPDGRRTAGRHTA